MEEFFKMVYQGTIPNKLFNSREIQRISKFKIRGLKAAFLNSFSKKLIRSGKIQKYDSNAKLPNYARKVFENFQKNQLNKNLCLIRKFISFLLRANKVIFYRLAFIPETSPDKRL